MVKTALLLAAGVGARLGDSAENRPKALLRFGGKTLLQRHLDVLASCGIHDIVIAVGFRADLIAEEIARLDVGIRVTLVENPRYTEGSVVSLWTLRDSLNSGGPLLLMDADVLYDERMIDSLVSSRHPLCLLMDRDLEAGDEPVKICVRDGRIVDFRKIVDTPHDFHGESVGFFKLSEAAARDLAAAADRYVAAGRSDEPYEEALRDVLLMDAADVAGYEDVTGVPWIEIDFPQDVVRARDEILPRLRTGRAQPRTD